MDNFKTRAGTQMRLLREKLNKSQADVAKYLGITTAAYQNYEAGRREAGYEVLYKLAKYFGVSIDELLGKDTPPDPVKQLTGEQLEQKLLEGYFKLPKAYRTKMLEVLQQAVMECDPHYVPVDMSEVATDEVPEKYAVKSAESVSAEIQLEEAPEWIKTTGQLKAEAAAKKAAKTKETK